MKKEILIVFLIVLIFNSFLFSNGSICTFNNTLNTIYNLDPFFTIDKVPFSTPTTDVPPKKSMVKFDLCTETPLAICGGIGTNACQILYLNTEFDDDAYFYDLGTFFNVTFVSNSLQIRYKANVYHPSCVRGMEINKRVTDFYFNCNKALDEVVIVSGTEPIICYYKIEMEGKYFCDCDNCNKPHQICYNGECQCDQYTIGNNCQFLNITINTISFINFKSGIGLLIGDFQFIPSTFQVFLDDSLFINSTLINKTTIEILVPPDGNFKNITITDGISFFFSPILFEFIKFPCLFNCSQPHGQCNVYTGVCTCDGQTDGSFCENSKIYIDSIDPTDENGGTTYLYGYFGNITSNVSIFIGDSTCSNIQQLNESVIKCDVGIGSGFKDVLFRDRDLQVKIDQLFQYFVPITANAPKQCINNCGGTDQGICLSSGCSCISPWIGNDCTSKIIIIPQPSLNYSNPSIKIPLFETINSNSTDEIEKRLFISLISIVKLRELDFNSNQVNSFTFNEWEFYKINSETNQYKTSITNFGFITNITVTLQWFKNEGTIEFGNQIIKMNPSSIKYTIKISEYKFSSKLNQLQLIMKSSISVNKTDEICSFKEFGETSNGDDSNYLKVQVDNHSLYGRFIKRAIIDSIPRSIQNVQLDSSMNIIDSASSSQSFIGISIPLFKNEIILDPDFSVLIGSQSKSDDSICSTNDNSSHFSKIKIALIIIGGFVGITAISTIIIYSYYKKKHDRDVINEIKLKLSIKRVDILM
ncbi:hypothetical protein ACTA71_001736 [Dictyostelium dimigraforme]